MSWRSRRFAVATVLVACALSAAVGPATAQDEPSATTETSDRPDLYLEMPCQLGGFEPDIVMIRGEEHVAGLAADDPARTELEDMLAAVGASITDMTSGHALASGDGNFSFVVAIRIEGIEPGTLLPAYVPILRGRLTDPSDTTANVGGKDVVVISSVGEGDEGVDLYVYDEGDTIWMVQGPPDVVEITLRSLPPPR